MKCSFILHKDDSTLFCVLHPPIDSPNTHVTHYHRPIINYSAPHTLLHPIADLPPHHQQPQSQQCSSSANMVPLIVAGVLGAGVAVLAVLRLRGYSIPPQLLELPPLNVAKHVDKGMLKVSE